MAAPDKKVFDVKIGGLPLKLKSSQDGATVNELVSYVDQKISEAITITKSGNLQSAALLAALNIAEELILLKRKALKELDQFENRAQRIVSDLHSSREAAQGLDQ